MRRSQGGEHIAALEQFIDNGLIEDVIGLVRTGKEASVWCCRGGPATNGALLAAKVYRARQYRFKNDSVYQESRAREMGIRGSALRAFEKRRKSDTGREVQAASWRHHEFETLEMLYEAGAAVPRPYEASGDVIVMEYCGDEDGAASLMARVRVPAEEAPYIYERLMDNIELMLANNRVHGDLSPHNILYWDGQVRIIDFPQAVDPRFNSHARELLMRDVANVCRYFAPYGIEADAAGIADNLWRRFLYARL